MARFQEELTTFLALMRKHERLLARKTAQHINGFALEVARSMATMRDVNLGLITAGRQRKLENILATHYRQVIPEFGKLSVSQLNLKQRDDFDLFELLIEQWIIENGLEQAKLITATTRSQIQAIIEEGIRNGEGNRQIAANIRKQIAEISVQRALTIAITETHNAATFGSISNIRKTAADLNMQMVKIWVPTADERTRISHSVMTSHPPIGLDEKFTVGGEKLDRPGDPYGSAANIVRCRCALVYRKQEFDIE